MALTQIDFDEKEEKVIKEISKIGNLNKPKAVKKIIQEFKIFKEKEKLKCQ